MSRPMAADTRGVCASASMRVRSRRPFKACACVVSNHPCRVVRPCVLRHRRANGRRTCSSAVWAQVESPWPWLRPRPRRASAACASASSPHAVPPPLHSLRPPRHVARCFASAAAAHHRLLQRAAPAVRLRFASSPSRAAGDRACSPMCAPLSSLAAAQRGTAHSTMARRPARSTPALRGAEHRRPGAVSQRWLVHCGHRQYDRMGAVSAVRTVRCAVSVFSALLNAPAAFRGRRQG